MKRFSSFILAALLLITAFLSLPASASAQRASESELFNREPLRQTVILPGLTFQLQNMCPGRAKVAVGISASAIEEPVTQGQVIPIPSFDC